MPDELEARWLSTQQHAGLNGRRHPSCAYRHTPHTSLSIMHAVGQSMDDLDAAPISCLLQAARFFTLASPAFHSLKPRTVRAKQLCRMNCTLSKKAAWLSASYPVNCAARSIQ